MKLEIKIDRIRTKSSLRCSSQCIGSIKHSAKFSPRIPRKAGVRPLEILKLCGCFISIDVGINGKKYYPHEVFPCRHSSPTNTGSRNISVSGKILRLRIPPLSLCTRGGRRRSGCGEKEGDRECRA